MAAMPSITFTLTIRIMREEGHPFAGDETVALKWRAGSLEERETAQEQFEQLRAQGFVAYAKDKQGNKTVITEWDRYIQELEMVKVDTAEPAAVAIGEPREIAVDVVMRPAVIGG